MRFTQIARSERRAQNDDIERHFVEHISARMCAREGTGSVVDHLSVVRQVERLAHRLCCFCGVATDVLNLL
jgi:hypothetical protein